MRRVHPGAMLATGVWGGLMALERRAFLQAMLSRPLVAGAGTGLLCDDVQAGLYVGLVFELLYLGSASLGGAHGEHETLPAVTGAALAAGLGVSSGEGSTPAIWALAILASTPTGPLGRRLEKRLDERARRYFGRLVAAAGPDALARASRQNLKAMWPVFVFYGLVCAAFAALGLAAGGLLKLAPPRLMAGLTWAWPAMAVVAAASAVHGSHVRGRFVVASVAAAAVTAVAFVAWYGRGGP